MVLRPSRGTGVQPVPPTPGTPPKGSPQPRGKRPQKKPEGAAAIPSSSSRRVRVAVPAPWDGASQACPPPPPAVPLLADPGGGDGSRLPPTSPLTDGMGSQHRWPCATADWDRLPAMRPGRAASPPWLGDKSKARAPPVAQGVQSRGEHRRQVLGSPRCHARCQIRDFGTGTRVL